MEILLPSSHIPVPVRSVEWLFCLVDQWLINWVMYNCGEGVLATVPSFALCLETLSLSGCVWCGYKQAEQKYLCQILYHQLSIIKMSSKTLECTTELKLGQHPRKSQPPFKVYFYTMHLIEIKTQSYCLPAQFSPRPFVRPPPTKS